MDAINKAFEILEVFFNTDRDLSISEISDLADISTSTSHRIASILTNRGYLEQPKKRGKYSLSNQKLVYLSKLIKKKLQVRNIALPFLKELSQSANEAVLMSFRKGQMVYVVEVLNSDRFLNVIPDTSTFDLYSTGMGKIFLAYMSEKDLDEYLSGIRLRPKTPNTITDIDELKKQLNKIAKEGISIDDEEQELGLRMVAAPVFDLDQNVVASIGVFGTTSRISKKRMLELAAIIKEYALKISSAIGYSLASNGIK